MDIQEYLTRSDAQACRHPWELVRLNFVSALLDQMLHASGKRDTNLLDLGCGDGFVCSDLAQQLPRVRFFGVDHAFDDRVLKDCPHLSPLPNLSFHRAIDDIDVQAGAIDHVLLLDVIEHIDNDLEFLRALAANELFAAGCRFLITAPAFPSLFCAHDRILGHLRRYTARELESLARQAGMNIESSGSVFFLPLVARMVNALGEQLGLMRPPTSTAVACWRRGRTITMSLYWLLRADICVGMKFAKAGVPIPGLSCYLLCRKRPVSC